MIKCIWNWLKKIFGGGGPGEESRPKPEGGGGPGEERH